MLYPNKMSNFNIILKNKSKIKNTFNPLINLFFIKLCLFIIILNNFKLIFLNFNIFY
jgi:hypothetical protein